MLLTANLFPLTVAAIAFTLNTIAISYKSMAAGAFRYDCGRSDHLGVRVLPAVPAWDHTRQELGGWE